MLIRLLSFLLINFAALGIGAYFTGPGVASDWYQNLIQAPWTPPGWVFGAAWTIIMICFSLYMAFIWESVEDIKALVLLYLIQLILNIAWNPLFFHFRQIGFGLIVISSLLFCVLVISYKYWPKLKFKSLLIIPYAIWLFIATSLNMYIWIMN